jgi:signal transduction histidine kinase
MESADKKWVQPVITLHQDEGAADAPTGVSLSRARSDAVGVREYAVQVREDAVETREVAVGTRELAVAEPEAASQEEALRARGTAIRDREKASTEREHALRAREEAARLLEQASRAAASANQEHTEAFETRDRVVGVLSHDLKTPLTAIALAASTMLRREELDAADTKSAARILSVTGRMQRMVGQLLDFAQARAPGGLPVERITASFNCVVAQVVEELRVAYPEKEVLSREAEEIEGWFDPDRLHEALANLVGNALQHGGPGPVTVALEQDAEGVRLRVHNQGEPVPDWLLPRLFEPFQRAGGKKQGSVGLGLYIARSIVAAHGGSIEVQSSAAEGTTFTMHLPRWALPPKT